MKKTASLQVLDEYAKKLTKKQVSMLYEAKRNLKYTKKLYEDDDNSMSLYLDMYVLDENDIQCHDLVTDIRESLGNSMDIKVAETGIMISTDNTKLYGKLLGLVEAAGVPTSILNSLVDENYKFS